MNKLLLCTVIAMSLPTLANAAEYKIEMKFNEDSGNVYFEPKNLTIKSGDSVIFTHVDPYNIHNIMFEPNAIPKGTDIPMMSPDEMNEGDTWKVTFDKSGTYKYHCHPHYDMGMMGQIIVDYPSKPKEMNVNMDEDHHGTGGSMNDGGRHH